VNVPLIVNHISACSYRAKGHSDAAKRIADTVTLHWVAGGWDMCVGRWMAFALADGQSDKQLYPSKYDAVRMQKSRFQDYFFIRIVPGGMNICEAESILMLHRKARERDIASPDLDARNAGRDLIPRITGEDRNSLIRELGGRH
jgi:hypothetical protein